MLDPVTFPPPVLTGSGSTGPPFGISALKKPPEVRTHLEQMPQMSKFAVDFCALFRYA